MALLCATTNTFLSGATHGFVLPHWKKCRKEPVSIGVWKDVSRLIDIDSCATMIEAKPKKTISSSGIAPCMSRLSLIQEVAVSQIFFRNKVPYVIFLEPIFHEKKEKSTVLKSVHMEDCVLGDASIVFKESPVTVEERKCRLKIALQVALALRGIHAAGIVHHDVKPNNILITLEKGQMQAKLSDYGFSKRIGIGLSGTPGTLIYLPPEILRSGEKTARPETDMWAFGLSLLEMYHGERSNLFFSYSTQKMYPCLLDRIKDIQKQVLSDIVQNLDESDPVDVLIKNLLHEDPSQRPSSSEVASRIEKIPVLFQI